jgi:GNAT superfamily N-acetyltransferase
VPVSASSPAAIQFSTIPSPAGSSPAAVVWAAPATLHEVLTPAQAREFLGFPVRLYHHDPHFIRPLDQDIASVFDPAKNKLFREGELVRWLLVDARGQTIGRVAAFVNNRTAHTFAQPTGGLGFFECIDSQEAADQLLGAARDWLAARGMQAMDGPINFGDRDQWWGLLVDNFGQPLYGQNYNPPYYQRLFENFGFQVYFNQYTYFLKINTPLAPAYEIKANRLLKNPSYSFEHLNLKQLDKYTEDFRHVYNEAWAKHDGVQEMTSAQAASLMQKLRPVLDARLLWFAYHNDQPIGFFISLPELNELFRHVNGQLNLLGKLRFAWYRWRGAVRTATGIVFGVIPAYQRRGVEAAMILSTWRLLLDPEAAMPYEDFVMNWIGDFNPRMMAVAAQIGGRIWRTHVTYRYLFDRSQPFDRAPVI